MLQNFHLSIYGTDSPVDCKSAEELHVIMSNFQTESGIQFLTRIRNLKCNSRRIDDILFNEGLYEGDTIEITADSIYSKNLLLMHLLQRIISPEIVGGSNGSVLYIDSAIQFNVEKFHHYLQCSFDKLDLSPSEASVNDRTSMIRKSLENISLIRPYNSHQLYLSLLSFSSIISSNDRLKFIILDDVGQNYWQDFVNGGLKSMDMYEKKLLRLFSKYLKDFNLIFIYVRPEFLYSKNASSNEATYKLRISNVDSNSSVVAITTKSSTSYKSFSVNGGCITWL